MDNFETQSSAPAPAPKCDSADVAGQLESIRHLVTSVLILVLIISGTLNIFFFRQFRNVSKQLEPIAAQKTQILTEFNRINGAAQEFARRAVEFGKSHPDFGPILIKYGLTGTNSPAATPGPPAAAQPKK